MRSTPVSPLPPVPRTQEGLPPRSSAQRRISSWSTVISAPPPRRLVDVLDPPLDRLVDRLVDRLLVLLRPVGGQSQSSVDNDLRDLVLAISDSLSPMRRF